MFHSLHCFRNQQTSPRIQWLGEEKLNACLHLHLVLQKTTYPGARTIDEMQSGVQAKRAPARRIDIVVFGATGLSGTFVVAELLKRTNRQGVVLGGEVDVGRRIGIAGRSR